MTTARDQLAELDRAFDSADSTMRAEEYTAARRALLQEGEAERAAPAPAGHVSESRLQAVCSRLAHNIAKTLAIEKVQLLKRVDALELRCRELEARGAAGVSITAENVAVPGVEQLAKMMQRLDATLARPVKPVYDSRGILIGARRVDEL